MTKMDQFQALLTQTIKMANDLPGINSVGWGIHYRGTETGRMLMQNAIESAMKDAGCADVGTTIKCKL